MFDLVFPLFTNSAHSRDGLSIAGKEGERGPHTHREREREDERKKKMGVFWSINFKKHIEGVSSGMFRRDVKLKL